MAKDGRPLRGQLQTFLLALVAVLAFAAPGQAATSFGINPRWAFEQPEAQPEHQLDLMRGGGLNGVRRDAAGVTAEPTAPDQNGHRYVWDQHDRTATILARHGLTWYPILDYST